MFLFSKVLHLGMQVFSRYERQMCRVTSKESGGGWRVAVAAMARDAVGRIFDHLASLKEDGEGSKLGGRYSLFELFNFFILTTI